MGILEDLGRIIAEQRPPSSSPKSQESGRWRVPDPCIGTPALSPYLPSPSLSQASLPKCNPETPDPLPLHPVPILPPEVGTQLPSQGHQPRGPNCLLLVGGAGSGGQQRPLCREGGSHADHRHQPGFQAPAPQPPSVQEADPPLKQALGWRLKNENLVFHRNVTKCSFPPPQLSLRKQQETSTRTPDTCNPGFHRARPIPAPGHGV